MFLSASKNSFRTKLSQRDKMSVAKIKYFPQNPVGMASNTPFFVPSLRDFDLLVAVLATNIESRWDCKTENYAHISALTI